MKLDLNAFDAARLLVVGDVMLDRYWHGPTSRISPEAPVPVVRVDEVEDRPGGAANVALNIASLGAQSRLAGVVGVDDNATLLERALVAAGVEPLFHASRSVPTITKLRVMSRSQQLIRLDFESPLASVDTSPLEEQVARALPECDLMILSDYGKGTLSRVQTLIQLGRAQGKRVLVDPKGTDFSRYRGASVLTPNLSEFEAVMGRSENDAELFAKGERLRVELELEALLVTLSERGMVLIREGVPPLHLPTHAREVYDVTGAGDTVIGILGLALAAGQSLDDALWLANFSAGLVVAKPGTATLTMAELYGALHEYGLSAEESGEGDEMALIRMVRAAQQRGERVVMTNGCFDILHSGHVGYLEQARRLGDRLIVAVNDDASVARLKGPSRPVNPLDRRMRVLGALAAVDWVIPFSEDTPQRLIEAVLPDVLVKGGDYSVEQIAGHEAVLANGGEVKVLGFERGVSTSALIDAIRGQE
ncbi:bifunctional D-glycero-beta-D-manno-heptose-7-phosphate kinase/D-glycero-beta-D-manno-heptose 1-phosphate adenylyltransferase HldE [Halotalea alkalilenta]|uniref:bifunctional D-glycero-beta-D-manno-heptose-7-phosphate kinase/D-glycero-beta-D-manno-heptose 1-phosphate adenylyltransferase HldE n=1 Tax=Halotalea alkalilenta TaxID=376489 RepID=UPI00047F6E59|nr:bifunctional D-glycero-beta-D-manno-heptose-7-phosphate kinase/D-glycero-beta-D-manno-heptose 1-phosphate adenylyltransferase HldE [Halotalea alkalilenta]